MVLVKLFLAHLIGDFVLQPTSWINNKESWKLKSWSLYAHSLLHATLAFFLIGDLNFWIYALLLVFIHLLIDAVKISFQTKETKRDYFFIDQAAHFVSILVIWSVYTHSSFDFTSIVCNQNIVLITAVCFLTNPSSVIIKMFISFWSPAHREEAETDSLGNAGKWIGIFERLFVLTFVINNNYQAIGFLLAAKSVFRFGDLRLSKDRKLTEYILIGSLMSFGLALLTGIIYLKVLKMVE